MLFRDLADHMHRTETTASRLEMAQRLATLFNETEGEELPVVAHLLLGNLAPEYEGLEVGLAEKMVHRLIRDQTGASEDALRARLAELGDLGLVAQELLADGATGGQVALDAFAQTEREPLTVLGVHQRLVEIARIEGRGSQERKLGAAWRLLDRAEALEARYLVRFLVGKLRLGVADMTLLDGAAIALAPDKAIEVGDDDLPRPPTAWRQAMERAYNLTSDLGSVLVMARDQGLEALEAVHITPGKPVRPMLAERLSDPDAIFENVGTPALAELKYDGLRMQAHLSKEGPQLFSRRLESVTEPYPDVVAALEGAFDGREVVVEGEAVPVDPETGKMRAFQAIARRRGRKHDLQEVIQEVPIHLYLFDLLYLDGQDLTVLPLEERRARLEEALEDHEAVHMSHAARVETPPDLEVFFEEAVAMNAEGVMVKQLGEGSSYQAGARGWRWVKYKRDYVEDLADSLDLVIVGAWHGRGRRAGWYGTLLGAAYHPHEDRWETVCKIGTGFTDEMLARLNEVLDPHQSRGPSPNVEVALEPDVHFHPEVVAEVRGAEMTRSPVHTAAKGPEGGVALRFPRFIRWRSDKGARDATTVGEVEEMYHRQFDQRSREEDHEGQP